MVITKGMSWAVPDVDALPEIDFEAVAELLNLTFSDDICDDIKHALAEYIAQVRCWGNLPPARDQQKIHNAVEEACLLLESFLEWDSPGILSEDEYDPMKKYLYDSVTPDVDCIVNEAEGVSRMIVEKSESPEVSEKEHIQFDGKAVADYLALCRGRINEVKGLPYKSGRRDKFAIRRCLIWLKGCFNRAGGEGRGAQRSSDGTFKGPFLSFSKIFLDYTNGPLGHKESPFSESALGTLVVNKFKL